MNFSRFNYRIVLFPFLLMVLIFLLWSTLMDIGEFVRGVGKIVPAGDIKKVQHLEGGIVSQILVKEGQKVKKGQVMYKIRNELAISDLNQVEVQQASLRAREIRFNALLNGSEYIQFPRELAEKVPNILDSESKLFFQTKDRIANTIKVLNNQIEQKRLDLRELRGRLKNTSIEREYARKHKIITEKLAKSGAGSRDEYIKAVREHQSLTTEVESIESKIPTAQKAIAEAEAKLEETRNMTKVELQESLSKVLMEMSKLEENIKGVRDRVIRTDIVSPVNGIVKKMNFNTVGGIIRAGEVVAEVLPSDDVLMIDAKIPPKDRSRVWPGQEVNISITAYSSSIYGNIKGTILEVSADTFIEEATRQEYYKLKIQANRTAYGFEKPLYPGMVAEVNVVTGHRSILSYLAKPVLRVFRRSMIEP